MNATLLVVSGKTTKRKVKLKLPCVLGRSREADVTVAHPLISRKHCELWETDGLLMLRDLASLNGTMIGGRRITTAPLLPDAEFTIGPLTFSVHYEYDGELESLPQTGFVDEAEESSELEFAEALEDGADEALPADDEAAPAVPSLSDSHIAEVADFAEWADADPDAVLPAIPAEPAPSPPPPARAPRPRTAAKQPAEAATALPREPQENDSALQSGGMKRESPWSANEQPAKPAAKKAQAKSPPAKSPQETKKPNSGSDSDSGFGNFLDDLQ